MLRSFLITLLAVLALAGCTPKKSETQLRIEGRRLVETGCKSRKDAPMAQFLTASQFDAFCTCYAEQAMASITTGELRDMQDGVVPASVESKAKDKAKECARPIVADNFRDIIKAQCLRGAAAAGHDNDQTARDYCACTVSKAIEALGPQGRQRIVDTLDISREDAVLIRDASRFCAQNAT